VLEDLVRDHQINGFIGERKSVAFDVAGHDLVTIFEERCRLRRMRLQPNHPRQRVSGSHGSNVLTRSRSKIDGHPHGALGDEALHDVAPVIHSARSTTYLAPGRVRRARSDGTVSRPPATWVLSRMPGG
jgi:hypothetical protein